MVTVGDLHQLHLVVNSLIDNGASPSVDEVKNAAAAGRIVDYLDQDHDAFTQMGSVNQFIDVEGVNDLFANYWVPHSTDLMVDDNGLVLLSSMIFEVMNVDIWDASTAGSGVVDLTDIETG